jgi:UDP-GlcNAc:undecaprenyl-phosphate GlcNAc-1-phosphate transferase
VPRAGGLAPFLAFVVAVLVAMALPALGWQAGEVGRVAGLLVGAALIVGVGLWDDVRSLGPLPQLAGQVAAAAVLVASGMTVDALSNPLGDVVLLPVWLGGLLALLWLVALMNTVNWADGMDGLAAGLAAIGGLVLFERSVTLVQPQWSVAALALAFSAAALGFLRWNMPPARVFLGSAGAYFLGLGLGGLAIIGGAKLATAALVLAVPLLDAAWVIAGRLASGHSPFRGDRRHLHHRLADRGWSARRVLLIFYGLSAAFGLLALLLPKEEKLYVFAALATLGLAALAAVSRGRLGPRKAG